MSDSRFSHIPINQNPIAKAAQLYEEGNQYLATNQPNQAVKNYQAAIELNPEFSWAYHKLGEAFAQQQNWQAAIQVYHQAIKLNPDFFWSYHNLGNALAETKNYSEAIFVYGQAIQRDQTCCWSYYNLAACLGQQKHYSAAILNYIQAYILQPDLPEIVMLLGEVSQKQIQQISLERPVKSLIDITEKVLQFPIPDSQLQFLSDHCQTCIHLAQELVKAKYWGGALILYGLAQNLEPDHETIPQQFEQALSNHQELEQKIAETYGALDSGSFQLQYRLGCLLTQQHNWQGAISAYFQAIRLQPENPFWLYQGLIEKLNQSDRLEELIQIYRHAIQQKPDSIWCYINLGELLIQRGELDEALSYYQAANYHKIQQFHPEWMNTLDDLEPVQCPDFIILGTQKGGTTSLYYYLAQHPQIMPSLIKEIEFWGSKFNRGLPWYLSHFPPTPQGQKILTGEATPSYFDTSVVPNRLLNCFPKIKLIVLLRNPVERAISHYYQWVDLNWELQPLDLAVDTAIEQLQNLNSPIGSQVLSQVWNQPDNYVARGMYVEFLKKWFSIFPGEQILILKSEDFYQNPAVTLQQVYKFLELPPVQLTHYKKHNSRTLPDQRSLS
ncbi:MAG: tetratricopeptide repeat protein [Oscillatoriales cyanobacterium RM1_1_9]|nr:tetratricopeptide repeat protein [Oscillatoriales cyanobacterium RM1_1_9]